MKPGLGWGDGDHLKLNLIIVGQATGFLIPILYIAIAIYEIIYIDYKYEN